VKFAAEAPDPAAAVGEPCEDGRFFGLLALWERRPQIAVDSSEPSLLAGRAHSTGSLSMAVHILQPEVYKCSNLVEKFTKRSSHIHWHIHAFISTAPCHSCNTPSEEHCKPQVGQLNELRMLA
jgi:hypothetical protein